MVLVVGGSFGSSGRQGGAPAMASLAAMRVGAGLVTAAVPAPALGATAAFAAELMTWPLVANAAGQIAPENLAPELLAAFTAGKSVLAIGPGLGQSGDTVKFTLGLLAATEMPAVIDAMRSIFWPPIPTFSYAGEGRAHGGVDAASGRNGAAGRDSDRRGAGQPAGGRQQLCPEEWGYAGIEGSAHADRLPEGRVAVNTTGNPGMAKGGSGDLLTGMVAGLLAQHPDDSGRAVEAAVFLHGLAADLAVRGSDEHTFLATDSLAHFSQAFRFRSRTTNGYVWLQGLPGELSPARASHEAAE